jgi:hypothetical protein
VFTIHQRVDGRKTPLIGTKSCIDRGSYTALARDPAAIRAIQWEM